MNPSNMILILPNRISILIMHFQQGNTNYKGETWFWLGRGSNFTLFIYKAQRHIQYLNWVTVYLWYLNLKPGYGGD